MACNLQTTKGMNRNKLFLILIVFILAPLFSCGDNVNHAFQTPAQQPPDKFIDVVEPYLSEETFASANWGLETINAEKALKISQLNKKIIVAVIDTGLDVEHQDLKANVWNNLDGDNFSDITDTVGHGTHVSGIISAVCNKVSIMALKYTDFSSSLKAIKYAIDHGADVINYSGGGKGFSNEEFALLKEAEQKGIILVAAAGNDGEDLGKSPYFPAAYGLSNIISVAATDRDNNLIRESNYGTGVDIAAPGLDIFSSLPGNRYGLLSGTSQAAAFVSGAVALLKANSPELKVEQIKAAILFNAKHNMTLEGKVKSEGVLDVASSLSSIQ
jgi:subtilisin family serine protease